MTPKVRNSLLRLIPNDELLRVMDVCERVKLAPRQVLHHYMLPMEHVYFVESGLVSVAAKVGREKFVEVWLIGSEGLVGAPVVLAARGVPLHRRTVQLTGDAWRIRTAEFCELLESLPHLRSVVERYLAVVLAQTSQSGACNSYHSLKQRLARWLLIAQNATGEDEIPLTHGVLAELLGVRRASVTECLEVFQRDGTVITRRGSVKIQDATELSKLSCDCFKLIEREYRRHLLPALDIGSRQRPPVSLSAPVAAGESALVDREPKRPSG
ncbi:Crp/Fnr family transcriptional regulator [Bradyrhizobium sp. ISRA443]|uniref:Crp/Fnr family transcriptional regulator n=1 Tax=unclassified Bradyrhizobium TaxID=2631580 RepID=UPI00247AEF3D|nr:MULTISPECIES: Crp/Fnr family transcriptional regulator [unclassified Bradyrhizobium]WGR91376.1 Crp/Fnr family transcriptional regulator [Bradyrhizobium sp. ISRA435]WGS01617.1 Crp/Fnr family transcriptional regulator [Bradyrhizobium sp. ISRA436]WGS08503.1 Crp/Fnr family transcriptional regulator [Bradyrhizobium sp. ISRA437]WGS15391.1 Crp/Fnr family transcriptional regulator [Bradyrhizobium sp. ISRA443]